MLFLRILDEREQREEEQARAVGASFGPSLEYPYRWQDWAAPNGKKRTELQLGTLGGFMSFVDGDLLPTLRELKNKPGATARQKIISEVFSSVEKTGIDTERNLLDILDRVHQLKNEEVDDTHMFTLSQVYEGLLQRMGEKNNDGGQFFTPREIIRVMVRVKYLKERSNWGKKIEFNVRYWMYLTIINHIKENYNYTKIALCKETKLMWEKLDMDYRKIHCNCIW